MWSSTSSSLAVASPKAARADLYLGEEDLVEEGKRSSGGSWSRPGSGRFLQSKLKQARSFTFFSSSKRAQNAERSASGLDDVEHEHVDTDDENESDNEEDDFDCAPGSGPFAAGEPAKGRMVRLTPAERRSLTRKSAKKLGLTLEGEEIETTRRRKRSSFRRRASDYF